MTIVAPGSAAERAGLKAGDVILEVDGVVHPSIAQLQKAAKDGQVLVRVQRGAASFYAALAK